MIRTTPLHERTAALNGAGILDTSPLWKYRFAGPGAERFLAGAGYADYRTPIAGYYQCGSGTHPGGCVTGAPGRLAAQRILRDRERAAASDRKEG